MIKLDRQIYDNEIKSEYIEHCINCIKNNYKNNNEFYASENELFKGKITRKILFCESDGKLSEEKIKAILLMDFNEDDLEDSDLDNYFKTGLLICRLRLLINNLNFKSKKKSEYQSRNKLIVECINKYKNKWIIDFFPEYFFNKSESNKYLNKNITKKYINEQLENIEKDYKKLTLIGYLINKEKHIFDYSWINDKSSMRDKLLASTNISVCPYCNRQFVSKFKINNNNYKSTATIDHFYPKSKFPLFALSLYNFIPACHICNEILKKQDVKKIMYPFKQGYENNAHFRIKEYKDLDALLGKNQNFELFVKVDENQEEIKNSIDLFKTNNIYECHKSYVQSIINKHHVYSEKYKDMLRNDLKEIGLNYSETGLNAFLYNLDPDDEEQTNVILGRLTNDFLEMINENKI